MHIQKYRVFIKTVEYGSFTKAAEAMGYSQSGISRVISDLEREWRVFLLERGRTGVHLTPDGLALLPCIKSICRENEKLQTQVDELHGLQSGLIRIGSISSVSAHWLPGIISKFKKDYPNIDYELLIGDYTDVEGWILDGRADCGFLRLPVASGLETVFMEEDRLVVILPRDHPMADCERFPAESLRGETFMFSQAVMEPEIAAIIARYRIVPKVRFATCGDYAVMSMVESGLGISILPELMLQRTPYRIAAKELDTPIRRKICFALRNVNTASIAVKRFLDYLHIYREARWTRLSP
jgi:DNA-binding transcriptional LysR family regulator